MGWLILAGLYVAAIVVVIAVCLWDGKVERRKRERRNAEITDLVEREIARAYRAAGNPPPHPPHDRRRSQ
jgi:hypothetical protein